MPTARAIPSSPRRSAASMMKIRKISRIPAAMENEPNVVNIETNAAPIRSASLERVLLRRVRLEARAAPSPGGASLHDLVVCAAPDDRAAAVRDEHVLDPARLVEELLGGRRAASGLRRRRCRLRRIDDRLDAHVGGAVAGEQAHDVARRGVQLVGRGSVQVHPSGRERRQRDLPAGRVRDRAEPAQVRGIRSRTA